MAHDPLRAGAPLECLRFFWVAGWVAGVGIALLGGHPTEKSAPNPSNRSIHCFSLACESRVHSLGQNMIVVTFVLTLSRRQCGRVIVVTEGAREQRRGISLQGRWLLLARAAWVSVAILTVGVFISGLPSEIARLRSPCADPVSCAWVPRLTVQSARELGELGLSVEFFASYWVAIEVTFVLISSAIGVAIFWRKSDDRMALFVSLMLLTLGAALTVPYPLLDLPLTWTLSAEVVSFVGAASVVLFFYLFPDGRFVPRWTRWLALVWIVGVMAPSTFFPSWFLPVFGHPLSYAFLGASIACTTLFAQVYRYRRVSSPTQRQQTKWVVFGFAMALVGGSVVALLDLVVPQGVLASLVGTTSFYLFTLLIPLSIAVAVLRYHLYGIDTLINRTLVYGSLTVALVALYFAVIVVLQRLFVTLTGQKSTLAVVASTLLIAALFNVLRGRIQSFIDRRFYRRKYDARKTLETFSATLRDETNLDALSDDLVGVVRETMQPAYVSLWLRPPAKTGKDMDKEQSW